MRPGEIKLFYWIIEGGKGVQNSLFANLWSLHIMFLFLIESEEKKEAKEKEKNVKINLGTHYICREKGGNVEVWSWVIGERLSPWKEREKMNWVFTWNEFKLLKINMRFSKVTWKNDSRCKF